MDRCSIVIFKVLNSSKGQDPVIDLQLIQLMSLTKGKRSNMSAKGLLGMTIFFISRIHYYT